MMEVPRMPNAGLDRGPAAAGVHWSDVVGPERVLTTRRSQPMLMREPTLERFRGPSVRA